MERAQVLEKVLAMARDYGARPPSDIAPTAHLTKDLHMSAFGIGGLALAIEDEFGIKAPQDAEQSIRTINDIVDYICGQVTENAAITRINRLPADGASQELFRCCGSHRWIEGMVSRRPFADLEDMVRVAGRVWDSMDKSDWLEAFTHHPRIGEKALREKFASTANWASGEQAGVNAATENVIRGLADGNDRYFEKFGYIFIVCATGKSASEMLDILQSRLPNDPETEIRIAAAEQKKITEIRLRKL